MRVTVLWFISESIFQDELGSFVLTLIIQCFYRNVRHEAAQKMREGPSKSACRSRLQTA
jgi:hypothetical protein